MPRIFMQITKLRVLPFWDLNPYRPYLRMLKRNNNLMEYLKRPKSEKPPLFVRGWGSDPISQ